MKELRLPWKFQRLVDPLDRTQTMGWYLLDCMGGHIAKFPKTAEEEIKHIVSCVNTNFKKEQSP